MTARRRIQDRLQVLGRALMLPIAVLPVAGIMLRIGQPDLLDLPFIAAAGSAIFANLGLLFAIGVGVGIAREQHGAAALAGAVAYLVLVEGAKQLIRVPADALPAITLDEPTRAALSAAWRDKEMAKLSVPAGILSGIAAGVLYNRFHAVRLPEYLSFFAGRRLVPILSGLAGLVAAAAFGYGYPVLETGVDQLSHAVTRAGPFGLFAYGALNRLLIVTGLHHILNNIAWFVLGDFGGKTGDLNRFFAGDPSAGAFMAGFFPVMMFGLPAACLAMWRQARPDRRAAVGGMLLSLGLTSFLTGVTEPIEFTFMFLAPALYVLHALLTGAAMALMDALGVRLGFGFSAGLFDYLLNFRLATRPLLLLPVGAVYFALYYATFNVAIRRLDLPTPGREPADEAPTADVATGDERGRRYVTALGGNANLVEVSACTTRLRLVLRDRAAVDEPRLRALGSRGSIAVGEGGLQVVVGPEADGIADEIRAAWRSGAPSPTLAAAQPAPAAPAAEPTASDTAALAALFGGDANLLSTATVATRTVVRVRDADAIDAAALAQAYPDRHFRSGAGAYHLLTD
jgi:PTS system N-acetylglucosamine-specific IIC component